MSSRPFPSSLVSNPSPVSAVRVEARAFGGFRLRVEGHEVDSRAWKSANARWLVLYLLLNQGRIVAKGTLRQLFWPCSPVDKGQRALITTVFRARRAVGRRELISCGDRGYGLARAMNLSFDVKEFLDCYSQAVEAAENGQRERIATLNERMELLYTGPFVPECTDHWCNLFRQRLKKKRLEVLEWSGLAAGHPGPSEQH